MVKELVIYKQKNKPYMIIYICITFLHVNVSSPTLEIHIDRHKMSRLE